MQRNLLETAEYQVSTFPFSFAHTLPSLHCVSDKLVYTEYFTTVIFVSAKTTKQITKNNISSSVMKVSAFSFALYIVKILMSRVMCYFGGSASDKSFMYKIDLCAWKKCRGLSHLKLSNIKHFYKLEQYLLTGSRVLFQSCVLKGTSVLIKRFL